MIDLICKLKSLTKTPLLKRRGKMLCINKRTFLPYTFINHHRTKLSMFVSFLTAYNHFIQQQYMSRSHQTRGRPQLPDYHSATQMAHMARRKGMGQHGRSHSCEGVLGGLYRNISTGSYNEHADGDGKCAFRPSVKIFK